MSSNDEENPFGETPQGDGDVDDVSNNFKKLTVSLNQILGRFKMLLSDIPNKTRELCETFRKSEHTTQEVDLANKVVEWSRPLTNQLTPCQFSPCGEEKCALCEYVKPTHFVRSKAGKVFTIQTNMDCNSKNLIYLMTCLNPDCGKQNVGETVNLLKKRLSNHRSNIKREKESGKKEVKNKIIEKKHVKRR